MRIDRRQFLKYCLGSAAAMSLPLTVIGKLERALAAGGVALPKVIWLNGANCTGCTVSLANLFSDTAPTDIADLLFNTIDLVFHPNLMGAAGSLAVKQLLDTAQGNYILVVDGGIPTAFNGHTCMLWTDQGQDVTAMEAVQMLAPAATAVLAVGTCASHGGVPAGDPNPTGIVTVAELTGVGAINIPGCPAHPDWIVWTIAHLLAGVMPQLDVQNRPAELYGTLVHKACPNRGTSLSQTFGIQNHCLKGLGCRGPATDSDCPTRKWNSGTNWCIGAGAMCIGCVEDGFPDKFSPFYKVSYGYQPYVKSTDPNPPPAPGGTLQFTSAVWDARTSSLKAAGTGDAGQIVSIFNADTGVLLGATSVGSTGGWKFRQRNPSPVPHRLRAESNGQTAETDVANAPA
jgi:hydrogenase small subunit